MALVVLVRGHWAVSRVPPTGLTIQCCIVVGCLSLVCPRRWTLVQVLPIGLSIGRCSLVGGWLSGCPGRWADTRVLSISLLACSDHSGTCRLCWLELLVCWLVWPELWVFWPTQSWWCWRDLAICHNVAILAGACVVLGCTVAEGGLLSCRPSSALLFLVA